MKKSVLTVLLSLLLSVTAQAQFMDYLTFAALSLTSSTQQVSPGPGSLLGWDCYNPNAAIAYVQIFDATTGVVLGTTVPNRVIPLNHNTTTGLQAPSPPFGVANGIQAAATTTQSGSTAPVSPVACEFYYR
jgi:hypothetical protein